MAGSNCGFSLDSAANITMTTFNTTYFNYTNTSMTQGSHNVVFACNDTAGNMNASSGVRAFGIDSIAPIITITAPTNTTYTTSSIPFNFSLNEAGYCEYSLDNGVTNYTMTVNSSNTGFNATNTSIADGSYTARAYCNDTAGNMNNSASVVFSVENTQLSTCINLDAANTVYTMNQSVNTTATCFRILASNITLDCQGYTINYSSTSTNTGYGVYANYSSATIKNCVIKEGATFSSERSRFAIYFLGASNGTIQNNTITTTSYADEAMYIINSNYTTITSILLQLHIHLHILYTHLQVIMQM